MKPWERPRARCLPAPVFPRGHRARGRSHSLPPPRGGFAGQYPPMTEQTDSEGRLRHLLTLEGLPRHAMVALLDRAQVFADGADARQALAGTAVCKIGRASCRGRAE